MGKKYHIDRIASFLVLYSVMMTVVLYAKYALGYTECIMPKSFVDRVDIQDGDKSRKTLSNDDIIWMKSTIDIRGLICYSIIGMLGATYLAFSKMKYLDAQYRAFRKKKEENEK